MKKLISMILACVMFVTGSVTNANYLSISENADASITNDTNVKVVKYVNDEEIVVYTGPASLYDSGICSDIDFE